MMSASLDVFHYQPSNLFVVLWEVEKWNKYKKLQKIKILWRTFHHKKPLNFLERECMEFLVVLSPHPHEHHVPMMFSTVAELGIQLSSGWRNSKYTKTYL